MLKHVLSLERLDQEEPKRTRSLCHCLRSQLSLPQQIELILTYLLRAKLVGSTMEMFGELLNRVQVAPCGARRVVATLEFVAPPVADFTHNDLLVSLALPPTSPTPLGRHKCTIRRAS